MTNSFQRIGSVSNAQVGRDFENEVLEHFRQAGVSLRRNYRVFIGHSRKKERQFDLGSDNPPILVECKSHTWTAGGNVPSAKITVWNEAMYHFLLAPKGFRKILLVLRDFSEKRGETLAEYYSRNHGHLIPGDVEIWEYEKGSFRNVTEVKLGR